jgi:hypothetical protein
VSGPTPGQTAARQTTPAAQSEAGETDHSRERYPGRPPPVIVDARFRCVLKGEEIMSNISGAARRLFTRRGLSVLLACSASMAAILTVGVDGAGATVGNTPIARGYVNYTTGCRIVVGDRPGVAAVGEVDVYGCRHDYYLRDWVALQHWNGVRWVTLAWRRTRVFYTHGLDAWTAPFCGTGHWRTLAEVSFNGGRNWTRLLSSKVNRVPYTTACG